MRSNTPGPIEERGTTNDANKSMAILKGILQPVAREIALCREASNGIVLVVHAPGDTARDAMRTLGIVLKNDGTTVLGIACDQAAQALGHDQVTRRWCETPPRDGQIKVFLVSGDGSALLTLNFTDGGVAIRKEPDLYPVPR